MICSLIYRLARGGMAGSIRGHTLAPYDVTVARLCWGGTVQKLASVKILAVFCTPEFSLRNFIAHFCNSSIKVKNDTSAFVTLSKLGGMPTIQYPVKYGVKYPRFSFTAATAMSTWSKSLLNIEVHTWLYFLTLRHLPYTLHHATNKIARIVAKRKSSITNFIIFLLSTSTAIWMHSFLNKSFLR